MKDTELKIKLERQAKFMREHTMTKEDQVRMIREKFERAQAYSEALKRREILLKGR